MFGDKPSLPLDGCSREKGCRCCYLPHRLQSSALRRFLDVTIVLARVSMCRFGVYHGGKDASLSMRDEQCSYLEPTQICHSPSTDRPAKHGGRYRI